MNELFNNLAELFAELIDKYKSVKPLGSRADIGGEVELNEYAMKLKDLLNADLADDKKNFKPVRCKNVFISRNNADDPFYAIVIPIMPTTGDNVLSFDFLYEYDVDLDLDNLMSKYNNCGLTAPEMAAWLLHELWANVLTDYTFLRYKRLLVKYYDLYNKDIISAHNNLGYMSWFGVFGNTEKVIINDTVNDEVSNQLKLAGAIDYWNDAVEKYVTAHGGDYEILTKGAIELADKACLEQFNKLARKYTAYAVKYNNTDYKTLVRYMCANIGSECLKFYISKEPTHIAAVLERNVYDMFDSRRLLREEAEIEDGTVNNIADTVAGEEALKVKRAEAGSIAELADIELDVQNVDSESTKLAAAARLKDYLRHLNDSIAKDPVNDMLLQAREKCFCLARCLANTTVSDCTVLDLRR